MEDRNKLLYLSANNNFAAIMQLQRVEENYLAQNQLIRSREKI